MAQEKPVHEVRLGKVKAIIWRNETDNGTRFGLTFSRIYKTDKGWESSTSFDRDELPLLAKVADMAHTWIYQQAERGESKSDRQVRVRVTQRGFRTKEVIVDTTLLDETETMMSDLSNLYRQRWNAELNLRSIKNILQMDHLRCKTPERVRKEFYMHMLAYNLIRKVMAIAAKEAGVAPYQISVNGALQTLNNFLLSLNKQTDIEQWCRALINAIGTHRVADRPDRYEPRVRKRRPKPYPLMTKPRNDYKKSIQ